MCQIRHGGRAESGFTLLEASLVIVVIGLLIGAVFVGLEMLKAAGIRNTIGQVETYRAAVHTFQVKYNSLPGDILQTYASAFGMFALSSSNMGRGRGDGNGLIECSGTTRDACGETLLFWRHLADANLIDGSFGGSGNASIQPVSGLVASNVTDIDTSLPRTKTIPREYFIVYGDSGINYFQILPIVQVGATDAYTTGSNGISPQVALSIDSKLDDGLPNGGRAEAMENGVTLFYTTGRKSPSWSAASASGNCLYKGTRATDPAAVYNTVPNTGGNDQSCSLRFQF